MDKGTELGSAPAPDRDNPTGPHRHDQRPLSTEQMRLVGRRRREAEGKLKQHQQQARGKSAEGHR